MSDSEEELDRLAEMRPPIQDNDARFQVSGWDDDDAGIEDERNPDVPLEKQTLEAAQDGKMETLVKLLSQDASLVHTKDKDGYTPLHRACYSNHVEIVRFLLNSGARHDAETIDQWQPLHSACRWNNLDCAEVLISYGADINATSNGGVTPLHLAASHKDGKELIQMLLIQPDLIQNVKDTSGDTPLDIALRSGYNNSLFEAFEDCFRSDL
ncbi:ankyrin repeat domain-containing protein 49-like [Cimex lectularius]|uniref:Ankyrin repeat domain-containing protein 49 n=1 Tax=Cimex lectularius TaxID=79782 RepID=A0A8I6S2K3_CIMLE|nr:ankyrin repeat domain-containing protein 49-like [Cimex lectularius]